MGVGIRAQPPAAKTLRLSGDSAINSQLAATRSDLVAAITQGARPDETTALIQRQRQIDEKLQAELDAIRTELVTMKNGQFRRESEHRRTELRRQESLLWLARVELSSLLAEMFPEGSADGAALSERAIQLIGDALLKVPSDGELHNELTRLLSEAQLRGGDPDAALRTMQRQSAGERRAGGDQHSPPLVGQDAAPLVIQTLDELALVIRIDVAKHRWEEAEEKLRQYYGEQPAMAPPSPAMDLARLRYLLLQPDHSADFIEVGRWLDAIQTRGGSSARRHAETLLARYRASDPRIASAAETEPDLVESPVDPRVLRADARYYLRIGQVLPAAIAFARASVQDVDAARSMESAIQSAAILQSVSKEAAAAELLQRTAVAHRQHPSAATLMLQAAALRRAATADPTSTPGPTADDLLVELIDRWPVSDAAQTARLSLIESAAARGDAITAAVLATQMPAEHWNEASATRCRDSWLRAIAGPDPLRPRCRWDDEACQREDTAGLSERLAIMRQTFAAAASSALAVQTAQACTILLDSCNEESNYQRLSEAEKNITDPVLRELARRRLGKASQNHARENIAAIDAELRDVVMWRLHRDLLQIPTLHRELASYLLTLIDDGDDRLDDRDRDFDARLPIACLMWSGQTDQGERLLRSAMGRSDHPADLLAAAASALAASTHPTELSQAARLWQELADGIPISHQSHRRAKVESIACLWRSGKRSDARAAAELMLLTNPPEDPGLTQRLLEWSS